MKNPLFATILHAIDGHHLVRITDEVGERLVEPYLLFESAGGDLLLHSWQRSGAFRHVPPPHWCNLHVEDIVAVDVLSERFDRPRPDYNPRGTGFHRVVYALDTHGRHRIAPTAPRPRVHARPKRRGPPARSGRSDSPRRGRN